MERRQRETPGGSTRGESCLHREPPTGGLHRESQECTGQILPSGVAHREGLETSLETRGCTASDICILCDSQEQGSWSTSTGYCERQRPDIYRSNRTEHRNQKMDRSSQAPVQLQAGVGTPPASPEKSSSPSDGVDPPTKDTDIVEYTKLKIITYNGTGSVFNTEVINSLLERKPDILMLQETWHTDAQVKHLTRCAGNDYILIEKSAMDIKKGMHKGRPVKGLAVYVHKKFSHVITILEKEIRYIIFSIGKVLFANLYLPSTTTDALADEYKMVLDTLGTHYDSNPNHVRAVIGGDLNSSLPRAKMRLQSFLSEYDMTDLSNNVEYTFEDPQTTKTSKLDYFLGTAIPEYKASTLDEIPLAKMGHIPLEINAEIEKVLITPLDSMAPDIDTPKPSYNWSKVTPDIETKFCEAAQREANHLLRTEKNPLKLLHRYNNTLIQISERLIPRNNKTKKLTGKNGATMEALPGFKDTLAPLRRQYQDLQSVWKMANRPSEGQLFHKYKAAKTEYFTRLKQAKLKVEKQKSLKIAQEFTSSAKETNSWNALRYSDKMASTSPIIENAVGPKKINDFWFKNYEKAYTSELNDFGSTAKRIDEKCRDRPVRTVVSPLEIQKIIKSLKDKKATYGEIRSNHLKIALEPSSVVIAEAINKIMQIPYYELEQLTDNEDELTFLESIIKPILKKPGMDITKRKSYRPICISSVYQIIIENVVLPHLKEHLDKNTVPNQHGYAAKRSTETAVAMFKMLIKANEEAIESGLTLVLLDASAAFESCKHDIIFNDLLDNNVPPDVVRLLAWLYRSTRIKVWWQNIISEDYFCQRAGVKQGGICSAVIFRQYTFPLCKRLNEYGGLYLLNVMINHLCYADDFILICPTNSLAQTLVTCCWDYGIEYNIQWNPTKTKVIRVNHGKMMKKETNGQSSPLGFPGHPPLEEVSSEAWLGYQLQASLSDESHLRKQTQRLNTVRFQIKANLKCQFLDFNTKRKLSNAYSCVYLIGCLDADKCKTQWKKLQTAHRNLVTLITHTFIRGDILWDYEDEDTKELFGIKALFEKGTITKPDIDNRSRWIYTHFNIKDTAALQRFGSYRINQVMIDALEPLPYQIQYDFELIKFRQYGVHPS